MDFGEHVVAAGKAVLDMMEREWQPLSAGELEHRLDQVVEEILESELMANVHTQSAQNVYIRVLQSKTSPELPLSPEATDPAEEGAPGPEERLDTTSSAAVQHIAELLQSSTSKARMAGRARLSLSQTVLLSLSLLAEQISFHSVSRRFQLEKGNLHRIFFSFCERVSSIKEQLVTWPNDKEAAEVLFPFFDLKHAADEPHSIPLVLGVLGHTRVPVHLSAVDHHTESGAPTEKRKKEARPDSWLTLELVSSRAGRFLHVRVGKDSDLDRGRTLGDKLKRNPELMPAGACLVARAGYTLSTQVLTPYTRSSGAREELFNRTLEEHCQILDRAVSRLKTRFRRLTYLDIGSYERAKAVVLTACVLHNVFVNMGQELTGEFESKNTLTGEEEGEEDETGARRRDAVADLLMRADSGKTGHFQDCSQHCYLPKGL